MAKKDVQSMDKNLIVKSIENPALYNWLDYKDKRLTVKGLPWFEKNKKKLCRLPLKAKGKVREVLWDLAQVASSCYLAFKTDAKALAVCVETENPPKMMQMPATGSNGVFLYCGEPQNMRPWNVGIPVKDSNSYDRELFKDIPKKMREFRLYLPNYAKVNSLKIGFSKGAKILKPSPARLEKPVVFYGTSVTNGGCANTAGADFVSLVGRDLNIETVNIGFPGNGRGDAEIAEMMTEIDASMYVVDYVRNVCGGVYLEKGVLAKTLPNFINILKSKKPETPILLMGSLFVSNHDYSKLERENIEKCRDIVMENYLKERKKGNNNIYFVDGFGLIPFGEDCAYVDNVHPTNYGFKLIADRLKPFIEMILLRDN